MPKYHSSLHWRTIIICRTNLHSPCLHRNVIHCNWYRSGIVKRIRQICSQEKQKSPKCQHWIPKVLSALFQVVRLTIFVERVRKCIRVFTTSSSTECWKIFRPETANYVRLTWVKISMTVSKCTFVAVQWILCSTYLKATNRAGFLYSVLRVQNLSNLNFWFISDHLITRNSFPLFGTL